MSWLPADVTAAPGTEPVELSEAKTHCKVDGSDSDTELGAMIAAARQFVEEYCGTKLGTQTVVLRCSSFCDFIDLPVAPIASITSIKYLDTDGVEQTLSASVYEGVLVGLEPTIRLKINQSWPSVRCASDAIRVTVEAGYDDIPAPIKHAMLLMIGNWFDSRTVGELTEGPKALLSNYRRF
jgi:uncharacterized phiE125 gp8 family phage protein